MQVLILGSTGLVGSRLLDLMLQDAKVERIHLISRRSVCIDHQKITEYITPLNKMENFEAAFQVDACYCCLGTTIKKAGGKNEFELIDYGLPLKAAKIARKNNVPSFVVVSALGASKDSSFFYSRVKGKLEQDLKELNFESLHIVRPSLIIGAREERRPLEALAMIGFKVFKPFFVGPLKKYEGSQVMEIAKTMVALSRSEENIFNIETESIEGS
ncbi:MAG: hypothetical protein ACJAT2_003227 [Bacteriovoracaceae bacterium]|jgi:uncharacterized protein YbjT (DUF2867 family)